MHDNQSVATRVRTRLRDELAQRKISQRALAERLERQTGDVWTQSRIGKVLTGSVELRVQDVADICAVSGISLVEMVREPGREYVADLTPSELRLVNAARRAPARILAMLQLLEPDPKQR